jgi:hypothetical protein
MFLSNDPHKAADFLGSSASSAATSSSTTSSPSSSSVSPASASASATSTSHNTLSPASSTLTQHRSDFSAGSIAGIVIGVVVLFAVVAMLIWLWKRTSRLEAAQSQPPNETQQLDGDGGVSRVAYDPNVGFAEARYSLCKGMTTMNSRFDAVHLF